MPSITFLHGSALGIQDAALRGKDAYIYQFGDHDPSGVLIPQSIERRLEEMCERLNCPPPYVERVALTKAHIDEFNLRVSRGDEVDKFEPKYDAQNDFVEEGYRVIRERIAAGGPGWNPK